MAEWIIFMVLLMCLVCSLTISSLNKGLTGGLQIWKWCLVVMVILSGHLVAGWVVGLLVFLVERNFMLRERVLYFVYGLRKSFQYCIWLGLVLLTWTFLFNAKIHRNNKKFDKARWPDIEFGVIEPDREIVLAATESQTQREETEQPSVTQNQEAEQSPVAQDEDAKHVPIAQDQESGQAPLEKWVVIVDFEAEDVEHIAEDPSHRTVEDNA
ncbi:hypothetical protein U1Q18_019015 [Sarracenia purpurea var. burkii]